MVVTANTVTLQQGFQMSGFTVKQSDFVHHPL